MYLQISRFFLFCFFPFYGRSSLLESFFKKRFVRQSLARRKNESKIDKRAKGVRKNNSRAEQIADRELSSFASSFFFPFFFFTKRYFRKGVRVEGGAHSLLASSQVSLLFRRRATTKSWLKERYCARFFVTFRVSRGRSPCVRFIHREKIFIICRGEILIRCFGRKR